MESRIKNWIKFNESQLDMFSNSPWEKPVFKEKGIYVLDQEDLEEYFIDFIDEGWNVNFFFAFHNEEYDYEYLVKERNVIPLIRINIYGTNRSKGAEYLTNSLLSTINRLSPRFSKVKVLDEGGSLNPEDLRFEDYGDIFIKEDNMENEMQIEGDLLIDLVWFKEIYLTDKMIFNYYELEKNFKPEDLEYKGDSVIVGFPVSDIKDWVLDSKSDYRDIVGEPDILDWFDYEYSVDDDSFFSYHLDSETKKLLIEKTIGNDFESLKEDYDFLNDFNTLEDLINATIRPGYTYKSLYKQLGKMLSEIEEDSVYDDLRSMYSDYYNQQKMDDDYDAVMKSFNQIVEDVLHVSILEEYTKEDKLWYKFKFNFEWLEYEEDVEYIRKEGLNYMISNWCYKNYDLRELKPYFSDYASIDEKAFNQECREILNTIQSKPQLESKEPKVGTGKKPKESSRRLYTDENPDDTVSVKFRTLEDVRKTVNSASFKSKSHKRQSQIINLIEQRLRVAVSRAKDPETKKRLKRAHDYIKRKCEASKEKTKRLRD